MTGLQRNKRNPHHDCTPTVLYYRQVLVPHFFQIHILTDYKLISPLAFLLKLFVCLFFAAIILFGNFSSLYVFLDF